LCEAEEPSILGQSKADFYGGSHGTATVLEMLRGIIIQSGNDASKAMAEHKKALKLIA